MSVVEAIRKYRPSNGTEGEIFHEQFCYRCAKYGDPDDPKNPPCDIQGRAFAYMTNEPKYPVEWIEDKNGPRCTAFKEEN